MYSIKPLSTRKDKIAQPSAAEAGTIPKLTSNVLFVGASGSGKSTLLVTLMTAKWAYKDWFDEVFLISPTGKTDDVQNHLGLDDDHIIDDLKDAPGLLADLMEEQRDDIQARGADKAKQICLVFDDVISDRDLMKSNEFTTCFVASRHYNFSTFLCSQSFTRVPRVCRLQAQVLFYFKGGRSEQELLAEEYSAPGFSKKRMFKLIDFCTSEKYSFLTVNRRLDFAERYRKNLDTIVDLASVPE